MKTRISSLRGGWPWMVIALILLTILGIGLDKIGAQSLGSISGRVTQDSDGTGISGVRIDFYTTNWSFVKDVWTDSSGNYASGGLPAGNYYVLTSNQQGYIDECYDNIVKSRSPWPPTDITPVNVAIAFDTPNINFALSKGGSISGRVMKDSDGTGIQNVEIDVYDSNWIYLNSAFTDFSGYYAVKGLPGDGGFPTGSYYLGTWNQQGYIDVYYSNITKSGSLWPPVGTTAVKVTSGSDTSDINFRLSGGGSIVINGGNTYTNSLSVVLTLSSNGVAQMCISNKDSCTSWEVFASSKNWSLEPTNGRKTVYAWFKDGAGDASSTPITDSIILDTIPPAGTIVVNSGADYTDTPNVVLTLSATDDLSGLSQMRFSNDGTAWSNWEKYAPSKQWALSSGKGQKTVYVQFSDCAGNQSSAFSADIRLVGTLPEDILMDFDGDGKVDIGVYRAGTGAWYMTLSSTNKIYGLGYGGMPEDIPVPADYDGDGIVDIGIYRNGAWFIIKSSTGEPYGVGWGGLPQDIPVPADYDGDKKADIAVYRNGAWLIIKSSTGESYGVGWGGDPSDIPVPADYDGDGKADIAVYRKNTGAWFIIKSSTGDAIGPGYIGLNGDIPVPGDYDGDGKADIGMYRNGSWSIIKSSTGESYSVDWGGDPSDIPLNSTAILFHYFYGE